MSSVSLFYSSAELPFIRKISTQLMHRVSFIQINLWEAKQFDLIIYHMNTKYPLCNTQMKKRSNMSQSAYWIKTIKTRLFNLCNWMLLSHQDEVATSCQWSFILVILLKKFVIGGDWPVKTGPCQQINY